MSENYNDIITSEVKDYLLELTGYTSIDEIINDYDEEWISREVRGIVKSLTA